MTKQKNSTEKRYWELKLETIKHKLFKHPHSTRLNRKKTEFENKLRDVL